jgi:hypothetical protein
MEATLRFGLFGFTILILLCLRFTIPVHAQGNGPQGPDQPSPGAPSQTTLVSRDGDGHIVIRATAVTEAIAVDGRLDETVYGAVRPFDQFVQQEPQEGRPATERTEVWVFFDRDHVYIAARLWDSEPSRRVANEMRHDSSTLINNEHLIVVLDTFHDRRNGFLFLVNPLGGSLEESFVDERTPTRDWNPVWQVRTSAFDQGWTVEMAVPFKSLRYGPGTDQVWGINMSRYIRWKNERVYLSEVPAGYGAVGVFRVSAAATLAGLQTPPAGRHLEIKPYAIGGITTDRVRRPEISNDADADAGVDVKYALTPGLTLDATINTDFAQVEEDEQQVNLTRFSLFLPEKREFFLEGQGIFNFGTVGNQGGNDLPILFFSRRIGLDADGRPVPIIAGGRVTGKVGGYSIGMVNIQTDAADRAGGIAPATAPTNFTVLRVRRDVLRRSTIGALFTGRSVSEVRTGSNETIGVDGLFSLYENVRVNAYVAKTRTDGLSGNDTSYRGEFDYNADRYGLRLERLAVGEHFNPEVGFLRRRDFAKSVAAARFSPRPQSSAVVRKYYWEAEYSYLNTGSGRLESREASASFRTEFQNSDRLALEYARLYELLEKPFPITTEVVLPDDTYSWEELRLEYQLGQQRRLSGTVSTSHGSFYDGRRTTVSYRGRIAVAPRLAIEPAVSINRVKLPQGRFTATLVSARTTVPITPRMFASVLVQYNSSVGAASTNARFRWEYRPGSELFIVYSEGRSTNHPGFPQLDNRGFVVKVNRLFRM